VLQNSPRQTVPPAPPRAQTGRLWLVITLVLAALLVISLLGNVQQLFSRIALGSGGSSLSQRGLQEVVIRNERSKNKIAVIDVTGMIFGDAWDGGASQVGLLQHQLERAGSDRQVKAVILHIDSPGGEVLASDDISVAIQKFQDHTGKPVVAQMGSLAASGGYYVAAPCRWIVANELTITGSIGVIMHSYNYRELMDKVGVRPVVYKSGRFKNMLSPDRTEAEILPEEGEMIQNLIDETFGRFKEVVREGREISNLENNGDGQDLVEDWEDYADGRILSGQQAFELGFVDELGSFDKALHRAKHLTGLKSANLVKYQRPFELGNLFRLLGNAEPTSIKVDLGANLPKLKAGHLYFLSPSFLPQ